MQDASVVFVFQPMYDLVQTSPCREALFLACMTDTSNTGESIHSAFFLAFSS